MHHIVTPSEWLYAASDLAGMKPARNVGNCTNLVCLVSADAEESDEEEDSDEEGLPESRQAPQERLVQEGGRTRRRALFADDATAAADSGRRSQLLTDLASLWSTMSSWFQSLGCSLLS